MRRDYSVAGFNSHPVSGSRLDFSLATTHYGPIIGDGPNWVARPLFKRLGAKILVADRRKMEHIVLIRDQIKEQTSAAQLS